MLNCYQFHLQSFYGNNLWLILAGNAKGLPCFYYPGRKPAALQALKEMGVFTRRYGLLLEKLRPAPKRVAFLVPFENVTFRIEHGFEMAYSFLNLLLAKIDVEPVSPEELDAVSIMNYEAVVLAHTKWLKADTVKLLEDYLSAGGNVILDSVTTAAIPVKGAVQLDFPLAVGGATIREYGRIEAIDKVRAAILPVSSPVVDCDNPLVAVRRALLPDGTPAVWLVHNYSQDEYARLRAGRDSNPEAARALEASLGYRQETVTATVLREDDGRIPFDLVDRQVLDCKRADGMMHIDVAMSKWEGKLLLFLPALPDQLELTGIPDETVPGLPVNIGVYVRDSSNALFDAPVPLQLSVRDPDGRENREYSRRLLAENGSVRHSFSFATNDRRGHWTIEVENQLTGAKISRQIRCRPH